MQYTVPTSRGGRPGLAALICALAVTGCEGQSALSPQSIAAPAPPPAPAPAPALDRGAALPELGEPLGAFRFTMYYVAQESAYPRVELSGDPDDGSASPDDGSASPDDGSASPDDGSLLDEDDAAPEPARARPVTLLSKDCQPIAEVNASFARQLDIQGTGKLRDGRVINTSGVCKCERSPCYFEIKAAWAMGVKGRLAPFRSVAIDPQVVPLDSMLYIPELDGLRMPGNAPWGGYVHDGCVMAEDRGGGIKGHELDFFVAKKTFSDSLDRRHRIKRITVFDGKGWCEHKDGKVRKAVAI